MVTKYFKVENRLFLQQKMLVVGNKLLQFAYINFIHLHVGFPEILAISPDEITIALIPVTLASQQFTYESRWQQTQLRPGQHITQLDDFCHRIFRLFNNKFGIKYWNMFYQVLEQRWIIIFISPAPIDTTRSIIFHSPFQTLQIVDSNILLFIV